MNVGKPRIGERYQASAQLMVLTERGQHCSCLAAAANTSTIILPCCDLIQSFGSSPSEISWRSPASDEHSLDTGDLCRKPYCSSYCLEDRTFILQGVVAGKPPAWQTNPPTVRFYLGVAYVLTGLQELEPDDPAQSRALLSNGVTQSCLVTVMRLSATAPWLGQAICRGNLPKHVAETLGPWRTWLACFEDW